MIYGSDWYSFYHIDHGKMGHPTSPLCAKLVAGRFSQWRWLPRCIRNFVFEVLAAQWYIQPMQIRGNIQVISKSSAPTIQQILMKHDLFNLSWLVNLPSPNVPAPQKNKALMKGGGRLIRHQSWSVGSQDTNRQSRQETPVTFASVKASAVRWCLLPFHWGVKW